MLSVTALCATYGRPKLVANALAQFLAQDHPAKYLLILDDALQIRAHFGDNWQVLTAERYPSLPAKYDALLEYSAAQEADVIAVLDDDDVYLPTWLSACCAAIESTGAVWSHPRQVWSDYGGKLHLESAAGRFHGSLCVRREAVQSLGGWRGVCPVGQETIATFDQLMIAALQRKFGDAARPQPEENPGYVFRWGTTGHPHCQGLMGDSLGWYAKVPLADASRIDKLEPKMDAVTRSYYDLLASS